MLAGGHSVCIVSSGAIALGVPRLGFARRPSTMRQLQAASAVGQAQLQQAWERAFGACRRSGGADPALARRRRRPADLRQRLQHLRRAVPARGGPGRERERRDGHRRDHLRRQRLPGGAGRRPDERAAARAAHRGRRGLLARPGNAGGGAARRRLAHSAVRLGRGTGLGRGGMGSKIAAAQLAAGAGIPTVIASGQAESVLVPIVAGERRGTRFDGDAAPGESAFKLWIRHREAAARNRRARRGRRAGGARRRRERPRRRRRRRATAASARETRSSSSSAKGVPIGKGIASIAAADVGSRARGLEVVHRDRLVLYQ